MIAKFDTRCKSMCEVVPSISKRCIRPHEHVEESHVWIEDLNRADGPPRIVVWSDKTGKVIFGDITGTIMKEI